MPADGARRPIAFDLDSLLRPANAFAHPMDVARDPGLSLVEKRTILASWASDARAVESAPALRALDGSPPVTIDEVLDALRALDGEERGLGRQVPRYRRILANRRPRIAGRPGSYVPRGSVPGGGGEVHP